MTGHGVTRLSAGTQIGGYRLHGLLGKGGMGAVYLAEQISLSREIALKVLSDKRMGDQSKIDKFISEARTTARLNHPGLVIVYEVGHDPAHAVYYYSMEYVRGRTLSTVIRQDGPLPAALALDYARQIAAALGHAHSQGLVHRDIKPENVLIRNDGTIKVADLGLAASGERTITTGGARIISILGTPGWSAPEQIRNPSRADAASDVFSLGCLLTYMMTGSEPFSGETLIDLAVQVCTAPVAGIDQIPAAFVPIIEQLTARDASQRPANGKAALELLQGPARKRPATRTAGSPNPTRRGSRRRLR
ncbi:MAG: serine/threonine-protein kinase [Planctomycetota bacterium]